MGHEREMRRDSSVRVNLSRKRTFADSENYDETVKRRNLRVSVSIVRKIRGRVNCLSKEAMLFLSQGMFTQWETLRGALLFSLQRKFCVKFTLNVTEKNCNVCTYNFGNFNTKSIYLQYFYILYFLKCSINAQLVNSRNFCSRIEIHPYPLAPLSNF